MKALILSLTLAGATQLQASPGTEAFANLKALTGSWSVAADGGTSGTASYEVDADGSVVLEHLFGMITTYYLDGDTLMAVHYCSAHNEPRLKASPATTATEVHLDVVDVANLPDANAGYMAHLVVAFQGKDQFTQTWTWRQGGADQAPFVLKFSRAH